jgi:hypothetical protein
MENGLREPVEQPGGFPTPIARTCFAQTQQIYEALVRIRSTSCVVPVLGSRACESERRSMSDVVRAVGVG